ncbi:hypothetical protein BZM27_16085 [Paraburkholderia steynii]|uniref:2Fe-2S ferredoxin-type domain-containing protein n=1 Tax=Paraburkholderia steynii TaxID=1245441 RepID=A0A4R0XGA1_9BURK|nr:hypothetical protein BZM27_16085 [Paraburkholderia steynii]
MIRITVKNRQGSAFTFERSAQGNLMEAIRDADIEDGFATCGGCCSCATCHVYVQPVSGASLPPITEEEDALLEGTTHRRADSRLACQVYLDFGFDRLEVAVAPEE